MNGRSVGGKAGFHASWGLMFGTRSLTSKTLRWNAIGWHSKAFGHSRQYLINALLGSSHFSYSIVGMGTDFSNSEGVSKILKELSHLKASCPVAAARADGKCCWSKKIPALLERFNSSFNR